MIPTHQIHNVLKAFTKNLALGGAGGSADPGPETRGGDMRKTQASGKRKVVTEQIAAAVRGKILRLSRAGRPGFQVVSMERPDPDPSRERVFLRKPPI